MIMEVLAMSCNDSQNQKPVRIEPEQPEQPESYELAVWDDLGDEEVDKVYEKRYRDLR